jgi:hypothetical protein
MERKRGFPWNDLGVGGSAVVVPIARDGFGGVVSRYERRWLLGCLGCGKTFCGAIISLVKLFRWWFILTMLGLEVNVDKPLALERPRSPCGANKRPASILLD